jgi:hypothetical protein
MIVLITIFCDILHFLLTHLLVFISKIRYYIDQLNLINVQDIQLRKLRVQQSVLIAQRDLLQQQIDSITVSIDSIIASTESPSTSQVVPISSAPIPSDHQQLPQLPPSTSTPQQSTARRRIARRHYKVGEPYPLPYTPPKTPEEQRRNNIVAWINELRSQAPP